MPNTTNRAAQFTLGFELEFEFGRATPAARKALHDTAAWWTLPNNGRSWDGSLSDGAEYRSLVKTYAEWRAVAPQFGAWLASARAAGCRAFATTTAGMHVHLGRSAFTAEELTRVLSLTMEVAPTEFKALSQRVAGYRAGLVAEGRTARSAPRVRESAFEWSQFRSSPTPAARVAHALHEVRDWDTGEMKPQGGDLAGRCAVALSYHCPTVEFRLWKGTLALGGWLLRLGATHAVGAFALTDRELSWDNWTAWVHEPAQAELYPELVAWLARREAARAARTAAATDAALNPPLVVVG